MKYRNSEQPVARAKSERQKQMIKSKADTMKYKNSVQPVARAKARGKTNDKIKG